MKKFTSAALLCAAALPGFAHASDCGEVSITEMNWASAAVVTNTAKFIMEQGYGCKVSVVPSDTVPAVTSVAENGEPDIVTELWLNSAGEAYTRLEDQGKVERLGKVLDPGGVEGWWIPTYLAEEHPELKTIEGVMAHPEWVGGTFNNCPDGWGCRVVNDNLIRALDLESSGLKVFNHGSGETLATSMASAVQDHKPWFGYYWGPTVPLGKYDMTRVKIGDIKPKVHKANQTPDNPNPGVSDFPAAPVLTSVTTTFKKQHPEVADMLSKMTFKTETMSGILAWKSENNASAEEATVHFLSNNPDVWSGWLNDSARKNLSSLLNK
ncbi:glycine betaine/proline ABC transporter, periplasmic glycine betaine/proline-binding protein [Marinobacter santoriniensis NKSG1]|jgi:glycine betaine/proline transport system substrate-binding protein|uniref:Glycine betaine/proline ABC transporter, periplasmic glycine betaine/proline-binding protein n=1 Tax=Marinobacter santoriniensis NKSG1 TaxID=1288826 RepID=M7CPK0_9GAMM|nr:ABC transporter substrate-binding protein [Marinobacter santoriniensis]EMP55099.1 glycine betaine/proline ABC transporter, periplasmic glycine betaine/proline-binding protein [Marinobacter santoriniensis NKSG1]